jgi:hypothetical protein
MAPNDMSEAEQRAALVELAADYADDDLSGFTEAAVEFGKIGAADAVAIFRQVHGITDTVGSVGVSTADSGSTVYADGEPVSRVGE